MPGIVGIVKDGGDDIEAQALLKKMARSLEPEESYRVELVADSLFGLGRVTLAIVNKAPQPVWNKARNLCVVMEGELYNGREVRKSLNVPGDSLEAPGDAATVLNLYETQGESFVHLLHGSFIIALWDARTNRLVIANDRLGLCPLYYYHGADGLRFASGVRALLSDPGVPRRVDRLAIAQFMTFDHLLHQRTLLEDVRLLPQATVLTYEDRQIRLKRYWIPQQPAQYALRSEQEWMDALVHRLEQAGNRYAARDRPAAVLLSGGLDSRVVLALLAQNRGPEPLYSFSWGIPGCDDERFAKEVARALKSEHHFYPLEPDWLLELASECIRSTDGMGNLVNLHARATLDRQTHFARVKYKGFLGNSIMGSPIKHQHLANYEAQSGLRALFEAHREQGMTLFSPEQHKSLFTGRFRKEVGDSVLLSYRSAMLDCPSDRLADMSVYFALCHRIPRHTLNGVQVMRSSTWVRLPFTDNDLVDLMLRVPPSFLYERRLFRRVFVQRYPQLAKIPLTDTGLPMVDCARSVIIQSERLLRWHLNEKGIYANDYLHRRPYKDYGRWFRTVLRDWLIDVLLAPRCLNRGYFEPRFLETIVNEHMNGADHTVALGALLTIELWHRQFID